MLSAINLARHFKGYTGKFASDKGKTEGLKQATLPKHAYSYVLKILPKYKKFWYSSYFC